MQATPRPGGRAPVRAFGCGREPLSDHRLRRTILFVRLVISLVVVAIAAVSGGLVVGWALGLFLALAGLFACLFVWRVRVLGDTVERGWAAADHTEGKPDDLDYSYAAAVSRFVRRERSRRQRQR
jgi:hypothetical protein